MPDFCAQIGDRGLAVYREEHQTDVARQLDRLVLDLQDALGGLGEDGLWMHECGFFRIFRRNTT